MMSRPHPAVESTTDGRNTPALPPTATAWILFGAGAMALLFSLAIGLLAAFITAQRIWPGKTEVECEPTALVKKVSRSMIGVNGVTTQWLDTTWPYTSIQFCGIRPPGDGQPFGLLVVGSEKISTNSLAAFRARFPSVECRHAYGLSEAAVTSAIHRVAYA